MKKIFTLFSLAWFLSINLTAQTQVWQQAGSDLNGVSQDDHYGNSVCMNSDGTVVAVGAPDSDSNGDTSGSVSIYKFNGTDWQQMGNNIIGSSGDKSGFSISLSDDGTIVAIGAIFNGGGGYDAGAVRIFQYDQNSNTWNQMGNNINGSAGSEYFGSSVSLRGDGNVVAVGAPEYNGGGYNKGAVRVYFYSSGNWVQIGGDLSGSIDEDYFGTSVSLSRDGTILAVGVPKNDGYDTDAGSVEIFKYDGNTWNQLGIDIQGKKAYEQAGSAVEISSDGSAVIISARYMNNSKGTVYVYKYDGSSWNQLGSDITGSASSSPIMKTVSINSDGSVIAIGNPDEGVNYDTSEGLVKIYNFNTSSSAWEQVAEDIAGEDDGFGTAISLSDDGTKFIAGAPYNDAGNGSNTYNCGAAKVYNLTTTTNVKPLISNDISVYPNPTRGMLNIRSTEKIQKLIISDLTGKAIMEKDGLNSMTIDMSNLSNGIYILTIKTSTGITNRKILKK